MKHIYSKKYWDINIFELFPYGIWNMSIDEAKQLNNEFELFPYGIWNIVEWFNLSRNSWFELFPYGIWNKEGPP